MIPRPNARTRRAVRFGLFAAGLLVLTGCDPRTLLYFLQPFEPTIPAPGPSLKSKRVVVITHAVAGTQNDFQALDRELTREVTNILQEKVKKIDIVESEKVWTWVEGHPDWTNPAEIAKSFEADVVVFLEIEAFQIQDPSSPGLLEGKSKVHIKAIELRHPKNSRGREIAEKPKEEHELYDDYCDSTFPIRGPIPIDSGVSRGAFKNKFLKVVATEVSWRFVEHSPEDDIQDAKFNTR